MRLLALGLIVSTAVAAGMAGSAHGEAPPKQSPVAMTDDLAANAGKGDATLAWVDPVVTGPVSPEFKRKQNELGCAEADWPHIPRGCFPD